MILMIIVIIIVKLFYSLTSAYMNSKSTLVYLNICSNFITKNYWNKL